MHHRPDLNRDQSPLRRHRGRICLLYDDPMPAALTDAYLPWLAPRAPSGLCVSIPDPLPLTAESENPAAFLQDVPLTLDSTLHDLYWLHSAPFARYHPEGLRHVNTTNPLDRIASLFHFTDRQNLPLIRDIGALCPLAELQDRGIAVPAPGSNQLSRDLDAHGGLDQYVHLCFRPNHPMVFSAQEEGRLLDCLFLQVNPEILAWPDVRFAPDIANKTGVSHYSIDEAVNLIDFEVLYTRTDWSDPAIQERLQQAERYEILVPHRIPLDFIRNLPNG